MFDPARLTIGALSARIVFATQANAAYPPARDADAHALPTHAVPGNCNATGSWFDDTDTGPGTWTKTSAVKCKVPGVWTDAFGYTWKVKAGPNHTLTGKVNDNNIAPCKVQVWPVTGTRSKKKNFMVTATNRDGSDQS